MTLNKHNLPVLPAPPKQPHRKVCPFNFEGNQVFAFLSIQAAQSELRTKGYVDGRSRRCLSDSRKQPGESSKFW